MSNNVLKIITPQTQEIMSKCHKQLNKIGEMTYENVSRTNEKTRQFLRENSPVRLKELAQMNCFAAEKIKNKLDEKYGKNNYVLIAVGRSISSIAELMGQMGADTKIIPLSGLRRGDIDNIPQDSLRTYKSFLAQIGLSKTDLKNNKDKTYIIMDYTHYGNSLEKAEKLLKKDEMLGNANNLISLPVSEFLGNDYEMMRYNYLFEHCRFKDYSYVGKLHIDNLKDVFKRCKPERIKEFQGNITQGLRKLFWFNVFDSLKENNYKKVYPSAEMDSLYNHYISPEAVKNYLNRLCKNNNKEIDSLKQQ